MMTTIDEMQRRLAAELPMATLVCTLYEPARVGAWAIYFGGDTYGYIHANLETGEVECRVRPDDIDLDRHPLVRPLVERIADWQGWGGWARGLAGLQ